MAQEVAQTTAKVRPVPEGYHTVIPYLCIKGAADALEFYKKAFGATEVMRMPQPDGRIGHADIRIGDSHVMLADEFPEMGFKSPRTFGGSPAQLALYVEDVDTFVDRAVKAGAKLTRPIENQFYGDRAGAVEDPYGHTWHIATHVEDVPPDEMQRRAKEKFGGA
jgi:PhnB protein